MAMKKIKLEEEALSEILVADTASELGAEASDVVERLF
jgi:DNA-directed RNA polymerase subunit H (RpoH/RPB5)